MGAQNSCGQGRQVLCFGRSYNPMEKTAKEASSWHPAEILVRQIPCSAGSRKDNQSRNLEVVKGRVKPLNAHTLADTGATQKVFTVLFLMSGQFEFSPNEILKLECSECGICQKDQQVTQRRVKAPTSSC